LPLPAIMSSSFREVLWLDTDVTPLVRPEKLFETAAFQREGALFWPDLWGVGCSLWGQTAWAGHVAWHLLNMTHNMSDVHCTQEHEAGHLLVDKERHWRPLCLANYLASRNFFTKVIWGYKDVFRLAWLKLNAPNWYCPVRPGLVGCVLSQEQFHAVSLLHFWPSGDELGSGVHGRPVPLYLHQKKIPGLLWRDIVTFDAPLGSCINYRLVPFVPAKHGAELWEVEQTDPDLASLLFTVDAVWNEVYKKAKTYFEQDPRQSEKDVKKLHPKRLPKSSLEFVQVTKACKCDYTNNRWLLLASAPAGMHRAMNLDECGSVLDPELSADECAVGYVVLALLCSQSLLSRDEVKKARQAVATLAGLLPDISDCLPHSFWPVELSDLLDFAHSATSRSDGGSLALLADGDLTWRGSFDVPHERLARFPHMYRRCIPMRDPQCWRMESPTDRGAFVPNGNCLHCCDRNLRTERWYELCFDAEFTEERCCNPA